MDWLGPILSWPDCFSVCLYAVVGYLDDYRHLSMEFWNKVLFKNDKDTNKILWYEMHGYWHTLKYVCYSTACGKVLIFSWPGEYFIFSTQQSLRTHMNFAWNSLEIFSRNSRMVKRDASSLLHLPEDWALQENFTHETTDTFVLRGKVAWIMHESCMCLAWKLVFSTHVPVSRVQRKLRTFPQAVL